MLCSASRFGLRQIRMFRLFRFIILVVALINIGCGTQSTATPLPPTRQPTESTPTHTPRPPAASPTANRATVWLEPNLDSGMRAAIQNAVNSQKLTLVTDPKPAALRVTLVAAPDSLLVTEKVYAVADRFATLRDSVKFSDIQHVWNGNPAESIDGLVVTDDTATALTPLLGKPANTVKQVQADALVDTLWQSPHSLAIMPFNQLVPRVIALPLDGQNILDHTLDILKYPLVVRLYLQGSSNRAADFYNALRNNLPETNRDPDRMTSVIMTGVTAMGRYTADAIDKSGDPAYPGRVIADVLSKADITHISNEIPFADPCPPNLDDNSIVLCSKPSYIAALKIVGADIIGLTGNHAGDFGYDNYLKTLEIYKQNGMQYYAGGANLEEARKPLIINDHGNRIAFLGANSFGPEAYWATATKPGTNGYDPARMKEDITTARQQADVVFVEFQADEVYQYSPDALNTELFRRTIDQGADVVTGVQNHQPSSMEFPGSGSKMILYGLGNLFFDQMYNDAVRQGLIPRHLIYQGKLLQTELLTTMLENFAQPRWATPDERANILRAVFAASNFSLQ